MNSPRDDDQLDAIIGRSLDKVSKAKWPVVLGVFGLLLLMDLCSLKENMARGGSALLAAGTAYQAVRYVEDRLEAVRENYHRERAEIEQFGEAHLTGSAQAPEDQDELVRRVEAMKTTLVNQVNQSYMDGMGWYAMFLGALLSALATRM